MEQRNNIQISNPNYCLCSQGLSREDAQEQYIEILKKWPGYSSTLFDVKVIIQIRFV